MLIRRRRRQTRDPSSTPADGDSLACEYLAWGFKTSKIRRIGLIVSQVSMLTSTRVKLDIRTEPPGVEDPPRSIGTGSFGSFSIL